MNKLASLLFALVLVPPVVSAMPLRPGLETQISPRGGTVWPEDLNSYLRPVRDKGARDLLNSASGEPRLLVSGTKHAIVVNIDYPDQAFQYAVSNFQEMLFGTWPSGSAQDYYHEVSYDQFTLDGTVAGWYTADNNRSYYGYNSGFTRAARLAKEAAQKADPDIDYSQFDSDDDGYVDMYTVIHSGYGREESGSGNDIHSHAWSFSSAGIGAYTTNDPWPGHPGQFIKVDDYTIDPERSNVSNNGTMICIGVFVHEWGHALGLPDLYDTDYSGSGAGYWALMAGGSWGGNGNSTWAPAHATAWSKIDLGWITPEIIDANGEQTIDQTETNALAYKLWTDGNPGNEYFLIENRQKTGFDQTLVGDGLLIYHIDENIISANRFTNTVNSGSTYGVAIEQADGMDELFNGTDRGDSGDPFPGSTNNTAFDSTGTSPDSRSNSGQNTHVGVNNISSSSSAMTAFFYINGETPASPVAGFSGDPTEGDAPLEVSFTDESTGDPTSWEWNFGDGGTSTEQNPSYTYNDPGTYTVILIVRDGAANDTELKADYITVTDGSGDPPVAAFNASPTSGVAPLTVTFTDQSTNNPTSWSWDFGDGGSSTQQNPSHTYSSAGSYTVTLTAVNQYGQDSETAAVTVTDQPVAPVAQFTASPTSGSIPLTVQFTDESTNGPTSWSWDFGDGGSSTQQNPSHTYTVAGTYTVSLSVTNAAGSDVQIESDYITAVPGTAPQPVAAFSATPTMAYVPVTSRMMVDFTDESQNAVSWTWDFGDGSPVSTEQHPSHLYTSAGIFTVWLKVSNSAAEEDSVSANIVLATSPEDFFASPTVASLARGRVEIPYGVPYTTEIELYLYNVNGQRIRTLYRGQMERGEHVVNWDLTDDAGRGVGPGVYFIQLRAPHGGVAGKVVLAR